LCPATADLQKVKQYATTEFIVGGVTGTLERPQELQLAGMNSTTGELRLIDRTVPLHADSAAAVAAAIHPAGGDHPWPDRLPGGWNTAKDIEYVKVDPVTVVEVRVDVAAQAGDGGTGSVSFAYARRSPRPCSARHGSAH